MGFKWLKPIIIIKLERGEFYLPWGLLSEYSTNYYLYLYSSTTDGNSIIKGRDIYNEMSHYQITELETTVNVFSKQKFW